ncbi:MAG: choice-of-anchor J domain-containing protein, partial [Flavobacteriales bacterium]|nr:choice-of-anchor J domain-containing protein [Flavobacteriales bacterium]
MRALFTLSVVGILSVASAQTLFVEDFESSPAFVLNTTDANSTVGITNTWLVNTVYAGGSGTVDCLGFPLDFSIGATPGQPGGIGSPNGNYLHTASLVAISNGIQCCSFGAADGFCTNADDVFAAMSSDVSTVGSSEVSLSFWWLCNGGVQNYGEVWYSTNSGGSWAQLTVPISQYRGQSGWTEQTASIPAFGNQATLRFGFRFHNGQSFAGGSDPGFAIDDVRITASAASTISTDAAPMELCQGAVFNLPYAITGTFLPGNTFTVQLSDASGDFAGATSIGSLASTTGGTIACTIPTGTPAGTGYRVRVVSSAPSVVGADNGADITIDAAPDAGADASVSLCAGDDPIVLETGGEPGGSWTGPSVVVDGLFDPAAMQPGDYQYTVQGSGACSNASAVLSITVSTGSNAGTSAVALICKNTGVYELFSFLGGSPDTGGTWEGPDGSPFGGTFNSDNGTPGIYTYTVDNGGACPSDDAVVTVQLGEPGLAGPDALWTVCSTDLPVDLFSLLENA